MHAMYVQYEYKSKTNILKSKTFLFITRQKYYSGCVQFNYSSVFFDIQHLLNKKYKQCYYGNKIRSILDCFP